jgi:site-specific DNA recombinase
MKQTTVPIDELRKTAISYLRVSTKEQAAKGGQAEGFSIPAQREFVGRKAETLGAVIVAEFIDAGESAKSAQRPDLQRMLRYLTENRVNYVLVHKVDRLARNRVDDVEITMAIKRSGARLVSATENIDETPSGMLLHGIMSSIAEFYSLNLAMEVLKGMGQKVKAGGTPGKAPLGYLNVGIVAEDGREIRTVEVDPVRGPLIAWAFTAYATGDWTLKTLAVELEVRGLRTKRTPKQPSRPLRPNVLHNVLTNPYYLGEVVYRGVRHPGNHQPLVDAVTWKRVQEVLAVHLVGEKQREHRHYLKSSVYCGDCDSRLIITMAKNRHGTVYPYFICSSRHMKTSDCTRKALLISKVEKLVEDYWATVQIGADLRRAVENGLRAAFADMQAEAELERKQLAVERGDLQARRQKLVEAIYSGAIPLDLIAGEQEHITAQLAVIEQRLEGAVLEAERIETNLARALDLAGNCHAAYLEAGPKLRRLFNQAFFTHLYIDEEGLRAELAEPFDALLGGAMVELGQAHAGQLGGGTGLAARANLANQTNTPGDGKAPSTLGATGGLPARDLPLVRSVEGLTEPTLVGAAGFEPATARV